MFSVRMWPEADAFLCGEPSSVPGYIRDPGRFRDATVRIADFWRTRWLASRLNYAPALEALRACESWTLSENIKHLPVNERSLKSRSRKKPADEAAVAEKSAVVAAAAAQDDSLKFWRELAQAGSETCADELPPEQLARLHVPQPLDAFLLDHVRRGFSLVLTGNAGDGKTHILRKLEPELEQLGAEVENDATAAVRPNDVTAILRLWKKAHHEDRLFCLAA